MRGVIILGSSRSKGNTFLVASKLAEQTGFDIVDLKEKNIGQFDYEFKNRADDFHPLFHSLLDNYDTLVFATPVYWYSMSGILKKFFDRISDFLIIDKNNGRRLREKRMAMLSCSGDNDLKSGFSMPFVESADYLGMKYLGDIHTWVEDDKIAIEAELALSKFGELLMQ